MRRFLPLLVLTSVPALFSVAHAQAPLPVLPVASGSASASSVAPAASGTAGVASGVATAAPAGAVDPAEWQARYDAAGRKTMAGDYMGAIQDYSALAATAPNDNARMLALEQLRVATEFAHRQQGGATAATAPAVTGPTSALDIPPNELPPPSHARLRDPYTRTADEMVFLYIATPLYGFTTGFWIDALVTGTDGWSSRSTGTGAFFSGLGATGLAALGVAMLDGGKKFKYGGPQSITTGLTIGFGEGVAMALWAGNRTETSFSTYRKFTSYVWGLSTAGIIAGSVVAATLPTTPGRSSWVGSTSLAGGVFLGGLAGAFTPKGTGTNDESVRNFGLTAAIGGLAGVGAGILTAPLLSPSISRVRFIDLAWVSGAVLALGFCEAYGNGGRGCTERTAFGAMSAGAGVGFIVGALATMGIKGDPLEAHIPGAVPKEATFLDKVTPTILPTQGGMTLGLAGEL